jgi:4-alpha-glucanotransferase
MDSVQGRAARWGIETQYWDARGQLRSVDRETLVHLTEILSANVAPAEGVMPRTIVIRRHREPRLHFDLPVGTPVHWKVFLDGPIAEGEGAAPSILLPHDLSTGIYRLHLTIKLPDREQQEQATLLISPEQAYQGSAHAPRRLWGLAVQLYGVRSRRNWGHGDFTDLAGLIEIAAAHGAAAIGLNPLHALFDDKPDNISPYSPNSRLFLNPLYIDIDAIPEFPGLETAGLAQQVDDLRRSELVDYNGVAGAKMRGLQHAYDHFRTAASSERRAGFDRFRGEGGPVLTRYACFEVLRRRFTVPWWDWPAEWRDADDQALQQLQASDSDEIGFHQFVQWVAHEQLSACRDRAEVLGLPIGLYLDIAVGVRPEGFDAWNDREAVLNDVYVGAPPDLLSAEGQNWGLAGLNPVGLQMRRFEPYRRMLQASMQYAGAIRLDHVLGLKRLFLIPKGKQADRGGYVNFPFEPLLAVTSLESVANGCIVIGEDLGTVPENFRETLSDWGIWSYRVMMFERDQGGAFLPPEKYREKALVTFTTHDLPTFAGWSNRHDLVVKRQLGLDPGESDDQRMNALTALGAALQPGDGSKPGFAAVVDYLVRTPARLLIIAMEDMLGIKDQPNIPGTVEQHPNWRRRLPVLLEDLMDNNDFAAVALVVASAGRSFRT